MFYISSYILSLIENYQMVSSKLLALYCSSLALTNLHMDSFENINIISLSCLGHLHLANNLFMLRIREQKIIAAELVDCLTNFNKQKTSKFKIMYVKKYITKFKYYYVKYSAKNSTFKLTNQELNMLAFKTLCLIGCL